MSVLGVLIWRRVVGSPDRLFVWMVWVVGLLLAPGVGLSWVALNQRGSDFLYDRTVGVEKVQMRVLRWAGWGGTGVCRCTGRDVEIPMPAGFHTKGTIFGERSERRPGVVLLHGSAWTGRRLSLYRLLAHQLAERGFVVLTYDQLGFGEAADPFSLGPQAEALGLDLTAQANAAVEYFIDTTAVDPNDITLFGHSMGVEPAIAAGLDNPHVSRIAVMVSPPTAPGEEGLDPGVVLPSTTPDGRVPVVPVNAARNAYVRERFAATYRFVYGHEMPVWARAPEPDQELVEAIWEGLTEPTQKPFLLVLAERDNPKAHEWERMRFDALAEPKDLLFLEGSDHYGNTAQLLGLVFYDRSNASQMVDGLVSWLETS